jgi:hypothetical protein
MAKPRKRGTAAIPPARLEKFVEALAEACTITEACRRAVVGRSTVYEIREADPDFAARWDAAVESGTEKLEAEAIRRAHRGFSKPVWHKGKRVGVEQQYSDTLLIFMLKARRPDVYRERFEMTGKNGAPLVQPVLNVTISPRGRA